MVTQRTIFHELGFEEDPVYQAVLEAEKMKLARIKGITVHCNHKGWFEIQNADFHELAKDKQQAYEIMNSILAMS